MSFKHSLLTTTNGIHSIDAAVLANTGSFSGFTAFPNKSSFDSTDVGKIVLQQDTGERYVMTSFSPIPLFALQVNGPRPSSRLAWRTSANGKSVVGSHLALSLDMFCKPTLSDTATMTANVAGFTLALAELVSAGGGRLIIPAAGWHFNGSPTCTNWNHITIEGEGYDTSYMYVHGLTNTIFLDVMNSSEVDYCNLLNFTIYGVDISGATAIRQSDWEGGKIDVRINNWTGSKSIGVDLRGRELVQCNLYINADIPVTVHENPHNAGLGIDHYTFHRNTLYSSDHTEYVFNVKDACDVTKCSWTGHTALVSDGGGFSFTSGRVVSGLHFANVRYESAASGFGMSNWGWNLGATNRSNTINLVNCQGQFQLFKARNTLGLLLIGCRYEGTVGTALDVDGSCNQVTLIGFTNSGGAVITTGLVNSLSSATIGDGAGNYVPSFVTYIPSTNTLQTSLIQRGNGVYSGAMRVPMARGQSIVIGAINHPWSHGRINVNAIATDIDSTISYGEVVPSAYGPFLVSGTTNFANTNTASKLCFYSDGTNFILLNNIDRALDVAVTWN